ncbi:hypothetical protein [Campylobacter lari]|nr:hypothetical protein [Campylobacter lari]MBT0822469.1 hypothetical protein [Campylobacter lari]MBT0830121.1 hypothetical protein [Campylobacter lari]
MKKDNELEKIGLKDFNSILYAKELEYNKTNRKFDILTNYKVVKFA